MAHAPFTVSNAASAHPNHTADRIGEEAHKPLALTLEVDSIHHVNCLRATGYLAVVASGGVPGYTYTWSNGNSGPVSPNLAPGTYTITVTDATSATATVSATILQDFAFPSANAGADFTVQCSNTQTTLNGSGSVGPEFTYLWTASNGGAIKSDTFTLNPTISHIGTFTLRVTNTTNGCTTTDAVIVTSNFTPPAAVTMGGIITCAQTSVVLSATFNPINASFVWTGPGGFSSLQQQPKVNVPGIYTFALTDTITTCTSYTPALVAIDTVAPTATASGGGVITCLQPTVQLFGSGTPAGVTFNWTGPGGFNSPIPNVSVSAGGTYILTVTRPTNGCTDTSSVVVIADNTPPTASAFVNDVLTCAVNTVQIFGNGSPAGVGFSWTGPAGFNSSQQNPFVILSGVYTLTVKNPSNGCFSTATVTVTSNFTPPGASATGGVKTCANPSVILNANSPTSDVTYFWTGPGGFASLLQNPTVSIAGQYTVTVTNPVNGCISTATATVTQNLIPPTLTATSATVTCFNPSPNVNATSQTFGATFAWTGPNGFTANIPNPQVTEGGYYTVTATNPANGCTTLLNVFVNQNNMPPFVYAGEDRAINCIFTTILANPLGTSQGSNFSYQWTTLDGNIVGGENTLYARFDTSGTYTLTVVNNQNGCSASDDMEVTISTPVGATTTLLNAVTCHGGSNGSVRATGSGGNTIYSYAWSNGAQTATVNNLPAGTYTVTVTDGEGCTGTASVTVTQPAVLQANVTVTHQTMAGLDNGTATVTPSGGVGPYTILWSTGATVAAIGALPPGTYSVTITDSRGCTQVNTATVNEVSCSITGVVAAVNLNCFGINNGSATASITGASGNVSYAWSNGTSQQTASNLAPGTYTLTATDAIGCSITLTTQIASPPQLLTSVANQTNVGCAGETNGAATAGISGGVAPYTFVWSNGDTDVTANDLGVGIVTFTVTDANGCTASQTVQIVVGDDTPPQLVLKNAAVALDANGQATVAADMFDDGSTDNCGPIASWSVSPSTFDCSDLGTRTVTLTATDENGNTATGTTTVEVTDNIAPTMTCPPNVSVGICDAIVDYPLPQVTDNCPVLVTPELQSGLVSGVSFPAGVTEQVFSYTDAGGNSATCSFTVTVAEDISVAATSIPASCTSLCDGSVLLNITGGHAPVAVTWDNGQTGNFLDDLCAGNYEATLTDASGCSTTQTIVIIEQDTEAPNLTCPDDVAAGLCNPIAIFSLPQVSDNCAVDLVQLELVDGLPSGSTFPLGATTQTFRYTDGGGNVGECTFTVTVHPQMNVAVEQVSGNTGGGNGSISINVTGGLAPYLYAWTLNGVPFANTKDLNNLFGGEYAVTVTDATGCTVASGLITVTGAASTVSPNSDLTWSLYPNPAASEVFLKINEPVSGNVRLSIFDATGRLLREQEWSALHQEPVQISLAELPDGWLLFRLADAQGFRVKTLVKAQ